MPARRCASPRRGDLARAGCRPVLSRSRRYRQCARPAAVRPCIRRTPRARPRDPRSSRTPAPVFPRPPARQRWSSASATSSARRACLTRAGHIAPDQGQGGAVQLDHPREATIFPPRRPRPSRPNGPAISPRYRLSRPATARRPAAGLSTPSSSPPDSSAPANPTLSTGRTRTTSSGITSSQPRTVASCLVRLMRRDRQLDQVRRPLEVPGGQRVADGHGRLAVLLVPRARPPVQVRHLAGLLVQQARLQHVGEEMVVAIPPAAVVERDQEQVPPVQRLQHGLAAILPGDGIAQRTAQPAQDARSAAGSSGPGRTDAAAPPRPGSRRCSGHLRRSRR